MERSAAEKAMIGAAESGMHGNGPIVEATLQLRDTLREIDKSATKLQQRIFWLNIALLALTIVAVIIAVLQFAGI